MMCSQRQLLLQPLQHHLSGEQPNLRRNSTANNPLEMRMRNDYTCEKLRFRNYLPLTKRNYTAKEYEMKNVTHLA